jgi:photosystem II stability/assembly factor-like uncharacterized protein
VEVGGLLRSEDIGKSWGLAKGSDGNPSFGRPKENFIHPDVHDIVVHPSSAELIFAPTGGGFYRSWDGGATWKEIYRGYIRAVWVDPKDPDHMVLGPANSSSGTQGRIEETLDGGDSWKRTSGSPWERKMVERFFPFQSWLYAVLSNGAILRTELATKLQWEPVLPNLSDANWIAKLDH